jgi:hypothetical protein
MTPGPMLQNFYISNFTFVPAKIFKPSRTNTLAYYEDSKIVAVKSFMTLAPGANVIKLFFSIVYEFFVIS